MELTFIGLLQILIGGAIVIAGRLRHALLFLMFSTLFSGSAAMSLPALGGSSIAPVQFALVFVFLRLLLPGGGTLGNVPQAIAANRWFALFALYGGASAMILPRLFAGTMDVAPMRLEVTGNLFYTIPLEPTSQNITSAVYLLGGLLTLVAVWIISRRPGMPPRIVNALVIMALFHAFAGLAAALLRGTPVDLFFDLFRNSSYVQMDDAVGGFARIRGFFPEASAYAGFGFGLFVANAELWYRRISPRATGAATALLGLVLFFSTSSTAYIGLGTYGVMFALRILAFPRLVDHSRTVMALAALGAAIFMAAIAFVVKPDLAYSVIDVIQRMTVDKSESDSSIQRLFWTMQGWEAFKASWGLGIGAGSFRSSSLAFAILGSMGVIGVATFLIHMVIVLQPWRKSCWVASPVEAENIGGALGSAAVLSLIPAFVNSATAIPGNVFLLLAGASLALRPLMREPANRRSEDKPGLPQRNFSQRQTAAMSRKREMRQHGATRV